MTPDQRAKRLHYHLYESLEGITEHAERIVKLEELVKHLHECTKHNVCALCEHKDDACDFEHDMQELGIEP